MKDVDERSADKRCTAPGPDLIPSVSRFPILQLDNRYTQALEEPETASPPNFGDDDKRLKSLKLHFYAVLFFKYPSL